MYICITVFREIEKIDLDTQSKLSVRCSFNASSERCSVNQKLIVIQ